MTKEPPKVCRTCQGKKGKKGKYVGHQCEWIKCKDCYGTGIDMTFKVKREDQDPTMSNNFIYNDCMKYMKEKGDTVTNEEFDSEFFPAGPGIRQRLVAAFLVEQSEKAITICDREEPDKHVTFNYINYRGEHSTRTVKPIAVEFTKTVHHPNMQWILHAYDINKKERRLFAMDMIENWAGKFHPHVPKGMSNEEAS